ncbi:MAG: nuclear transport factor 2 family protein [Cyclobacteriaceae bacterium]
MTTNKNLIYSFYSAFQNKDYITMQSCYAENATFSDPVFKNLNAKQVRAMWEMFCVKSPDLSIDFDSVESNAHGCSAKWKATYSFSAKKSKQ